MSSNFVKGCLGLCFTAATFGSAWWGHQGYEHYQEIYDQKVALYEAGQLHTDSSMAFTEEFFAESFNGTNEQRAELMLRDDLQRAYLERLKPNVYTYCGLPLLMTAGAIWSFGGIRRNKDHKPS